jgi:hypothetical protein
MTGDRVKPPIHSREILTIRVDCAEGGPKQLKLDCNQR